MPTGGTPCERLSDQRRAEAPPVHGRQRELAYYRPARRSAGLEATGVDAVVRPASDGRVGASRTTASTARELSAWVAGGNVPNNSTPAPASPIASVTGRERIGASRRSASAAPAARPVTQVRSSSLRRNIVATISR